MEKRGQEIENGFVTIEFFTYVTKNKGLICRHAIYFMYTIKCQFKTTSLSSYHICIKQNLRQNTTNRTLKFISHSPGPMERIQAVTRLGPITIGPGTLGPGQLGPGMFGPPGCLGPGMFGPRDVWAPGTFGPWDVWAPGQLGPGIFVALYILNVILDSSLICKI